MPRRFYEEFQKLARRHNLTVLLRAALVIAALAVVLLAVRAVI